MNIWNTLKSINPQSAIRNPQSDSLRPYVALITVSAFTLAIGLGLEIHRHLHFEYHDDSGIVGWVSVHQYPKQQEFFYYLLALTGVPSMIALYWMGWIAYANFVAKWTHQSVERTLKQSAFASLPLLLIWRDIHHLERSWVTGLAVPIGLVLAAKLGILLYNRLRSPAEPSRISPYPFAMTETFSSGKPRVFDLPKPNARVFSLALAIFKYLIVPVFIYLLIYSGNIHGGIDLFHEGERLAPLNEMLRGGIPFRDVYIQHGLFQNVYLAWMGSKLFGPTLEGVRRMERLLDPLGYVALYLLGLQVFRGGVITSLILVLIASGENFWVSARHGLGLISIAFVANYITHRQDYGLFSGWQRIPGNEEPEKWKEGRDGRMEEWKDGRKGFISRFTFHVSRFTFHWTFGWKLIVAGAFTSFAFWYSTEIGLYTLGAISLFLLMYSALQRGISGRKRPLPLICYGSGVMVGFWLVGFYFLLHGALDDVIWNTYIQCVYQIETWGLAFPPFSDTLKPLADSGLRAGWRTFVLSEGFRWYLPVFVFLIAGAYLTNRWLCGGFWHSDGNIKLLLLLLGGIAFFRTALGRSDGGHLIYGATFLGVLCLFPVERGVGRIVDELCLKNTNWKSRFIGAMKSAWIALPIFVMLWYVREVHHPIRVFQGRWTQLKGNPLAAQNRVPEKLDRAGHIDIPNDQAEHIRNVVAYIQGHTAPDEKIFDFTSQGAYYFFAERPSVTRFHQVAYASTPGMQREVIDALERDRTRLVIFKTGGWFDNIDGIRSEERHPLIAQYLAAHYELAIDINGTQILKRRK